ncbi:MAG: matrixin family metalloprotease [Terriglobia bacterium]|jgi:predicted Zn-dependent protease
MAIKFEHEVKKKIRIGAISVFSLALVASLTAVMALAGDRETARRLYSEGNSLFDEGRFTEAVASYDRSIVEDPKLIEAYYNRAVATEMIDRAKALEAWQRFLDAAADSNQFRWDVARVKARVQILRGKPPVPAGLEPARYVAAAGDYYRVVALTSEGEQWSELPVKVYLGSAPQVKWQQGAREAYDIWGAMFPMQFLATPEKADIRIDWSASVSEDERVGEESDWVRVRRIGDQLTGRRVATIRLDLSRNWSKDEMRAIILHELGHALGIKGHSDSKKDIMYWQMQEQTRRFQAPGGIPLPIFWRSLVKEPSQRDMNTLIRLYNSAGTIARFD